MNLFLKALAGGAAALALAGPAAAHGHVRVRVAPAPTPYAPVVVVPRYAPPVYYVAEPAWDTRRDWRYEGRHERCWRHHRHHRHHHRHGGYYGY